MSTDAEILALRSCYCGCDYREPGVPDGYCGACKTCGEPGHSCHYPGPMPFTGSWCDEHYLVEARTHAMIRAVELKTGRRVAR